VLARPSAGRGQSGPAQLGLVDAGMNEMEMGEVEKPAPPPQRRRSPKYDETVGPVNYLDTLPFEGCEAFASATATTAMTPAPAAATQRDGGPSA